ncbi:peptide chain release factor N(5)-glutamine methyltransferase [Alkalicoccobacillus porphyridii]|uniref:Release factor glutamine methyltransferase n=1 Tax=Alkalicoccobacillus porphyridii TaxID=2597270 RepID=A0A553ZTH3_9BACI|nr:peptide chain release factor N(5)-glutamine methyltransferase [Alkalicoccobacillus porphyridii]TSB44762.1 peptide chain release factor N(5)-glutamine methyltransferase [Alkalicoccobacillus porphyridii]
MSQVRTIHEALRWASSFLEERQGETMAGEWLLRHHLNVERAGLFARFHDPIEPAIWTAYQEDVHKLADGVPVQHLIGYEEFFGRRFNVSGHVLIPRPETEELIIAVLERRKAIFSDRHVKVVDVGTGSGIIATTLSLEDEALSVSATDLSPDALKMAKQNANTHQASITFYQGDLLKPLIDNQETFDIIVSNPPYIPEGERETLAVHVREHEPELALFAGEDGLACYRQLIAQLKDVVKPVAIVAFEVGAGQGETVRHMLQQAFPSTQTEVRYDINQKDRIVLAYGEFVEEL